MFELKELPDTLKYVYLDEKKIYPVIISANLSEHEHEEERLLKVLRKHRAAVGYTLDDLALVPLYVSTKLIWNLMLNPLLITNVG